MFGLFRPKSEKPAPPPPPAPAPPPPAESTSHGSAKLQAPPVATKGSPLLGQLWKDGKAQELSYPGDAHLLTVAKTGSGKGRHVILPNLARYTGSVIVCDPKGETAELTARWRRERLGQVVRILDPFATVSDTELGPVGRDMFNPVHFVRDSADPYDDAMLIAETLVNVDEGSKSARWQRGAQSILAAYLLFLALDPLCGPAVNPETGEVGPDDQRTPRVLWRMMTHPAWQESTLKMMAASSLEAGNMHVASMAAKLLGPNREEVASLMSELDIACKPFFSSAPLLDAMERTTIDFGTARAAPSSFFLVLPFDKMNRYKSWLRLMLAVASRQLIGQGVAEYAPDGKRRPPVLFIMDEFDSIGRNEQIRKSFAELRGFGIKFWAFVQSIGQLSETYGKAWNTIAGNCGVIQYFGQTVDKETRDLLSDLTGKATIVTLTQSTNTRPESGDGTSYATTGRPLLTPDEVGTLPSDRQLFIWDKGASIIGMLNPKRDFSDLPEFAAFLDRGPLAKRRAAARNRALSPPQPGKTTLACYTCGAEYRVDADDHSGFAALNSDCGICGSDLGYEMRRNVVVWVGSKREAWERSRWDKASTYHKAILRNVWEPPCPPGKARLTCLACTAINHLEPATDKPRIELCRCCSGLIVYEASGVVPFATSDLGATPEVETAPVEPEAASAA